MADSSKHDMHAKMLRRMAWERAKGELMAMLQTFQGEFIEYDTLDTQVRIFVKKVEGEGLHE